MYNLIANDGEKTYGIKEFVVDILEDMQSLPPCAMGSSAFVISTAEVYMLNGEKKWVKV